MAKGILISVILFALAGCDYLGNAYIPAEVMETVEYCGVWRSAEAEGDGKITEYKIVGMMGGIGIFNNKNAKDPGIYGVIFSIRRNRYLEIHGAKGKNMCLQIRNTGQDRIELYEMSDRSKCGDLAAVRDAVMMNRDDAFGNKVAVLVKVKESAQQVDSAEASTIAVPPSKPSGSPR